MTDTPLGNLRPLWLRPLAIAMAAALHVAVAATFVATPDAPPKPLGEIVVGVESAIPDTSPDATPLPVASDASAPDPTSLPPEAPSPEPIPSPVPSETPSPAPTPAATVTPFPAPTLPPTETQSPEPTLSPTPTRTPVPERTPAPDPTLRQPPRPKPVIARPLLSPRPKPPPKLQASVTEAQIAEQHAPSEASHRAAQERAAERSADDSQGGRQGTPVASTADLASYGALVSAEIARHKNPDAVRVAGESGVVRIAFSIGPSGRVVSHAVTGSSGNATLDAAASAMMFAVQAPPPPGGSFRGQITIRFQTQ